MAGSATEADKQPWGKGQQAKQLQNHRGCVGTALACPPACDSQAQQDPIPQILQQSQSLNFLAHREPYRLEEMAQWLLKAICLTPLL